tara:strand:- start:108 stop:503 length:396 start_codon:yes stop_codon:yes gene_type:complete
MTILDKVKIGNKVRVNLELSKDRLTKETIEAINNSSECTISDFKITDGMGIGVILNLSNGEKEWFFENEIQILDEKGNIIEKEVNKIKNEENNFILNAVNNINYEPKFKSSELLNPINFITWIIVSLKDIL